MTIVDNTNNEKQLTTTSNDPYTTIFVPARDQMVSRLTALIENTQDPQAEQQLVNLLRLVNPKRKGREEMGDKWIIPVIRLVQGVTKEKPDGAEAGDIITTSGFILKQPVKFTPLYIYEQNRMFSDEGKSPVCFAPDGKYGRPFGKCINCANYPMTKNATRTPTDCDNGVCFIVLSQDMQLYRIEFFRTSYSAGNKLDSLACATPNIWDRWYTLKSQIQAAKGKEWFIFRVSSANDTTPEYVREAADIIYDLIAAEREVFLTQHYTAANAADQAISTVSENVDMAQLGLNDTDNPDLTNSGI